MDEIKQLPSITLTWNAEREELGIKAEGWKTFEMQLAVLHIAEKAMEERRIGAMVQAAQQQQAAMQRMQRLRNGLH